MKISHQAIFLFGLILLASAFGQNAGKPEGGKPEGGKPETGKPDGGKPETEKPDGGKPEEEKPTVDRPKQVRLICEETEIPLKIFILHFTDFDYISNIELPNLNEAQ